jgi:hypothetical protein
MCLEPALALPAARPPPPPRPTGEFFVECGSHADARLLVQAANLETHGGRILLAMATTPARLAAVAAAGRTQPVPEHTGVLLLAGLSYSLAEAAVAAFWEAKGFALGGGGAPGGGGGQQRAVVQRLDPRGSGQWRPSDQFYVEFAGGPVRSAAAALRYSCWRTADACARARLPMSICRRPRPRRWRTTGSTLADGSSGCPSPARPTRTGPPLPLPRRLLAGAAARASGGTAVTGGGAASGGGTGGDASSRWKAGSLGETDLTDCLARRGRSPTCVEWSGAL